MVGEPIEYKTEIDVNDVVRVLLDKIAELTLQNAVLTVQIKSQSKTF